MGTAPQHDGKGARRLLAVLSADDASAPQLPSYGGDRIELLRIRDLDVLTAVVDLHRDAIPHDPRRLVELVGAHDRVVRAAANGRALVPMPFGVVTRDLPSLEGLIDEHCVGILDALQRIEGCDEWGIHMSVPRHAPQRAVRSITAHVYDRLAVAAEDAVIEPIDARAREERPSALSAAFLVNRDRWRLFELTLADLGRAWEGVGATVRTSGPWPAYDFARLRLETSAKAQALLGPLGAPERSWTATAPSAAGEGAVGLLR